MTKEEKIKEAYGEFWETVKYYVDDDGWACYPNVQSHDYNFGELEFKRDCTFLRPISLQGIEDNNGWIKIESESDLPKDDCDVYCNVAGVICIKRFQLNMTLWWLRYVTHYQPIQKPQQPIY